MVDSKTFEHGCEMIYASLPSLLGLGLENGQVPTFCLLLYHAQFGIPGVVWLLHGSPRGSMYPIFGVSGPKLLSPCLCWVPVKELQFSCSNSEAPICPHDNNLNRVPEQQPSMWSVGLLSSHNRSVVSCARGLNSW